MQLVQACPLCGLAAHAGRCPKPAPGAYWCGPCLVERLSDADIAGPPIPPATLLAASVNKTKHWCYRCGTTVCLRHSIRKRTNGIGYCCSPAALNHSEPDCRTRYEPDTVRLRTVLETYVPDFLNAGPHRCRVCSLPAYRKFLCLRHLEQIKRGYTVLTPQAYRVRRRRPSVQTALYVDKEVYEYAVQFAREEDVPVSRWIESLIEDVLEEKGLGRPTLSSALFTRAEIVERSVPLTTLQKPLPPPHNGK